MTEMTEMADARDDRCHEMRLLILGGTGEARALAAALSQLPGVDYESSLAGRVTNPALPVGPVRIGGFGGAAGLASYLHDKGIDAVIDATHPFAATISANAAVACSAQAVPLLILRRPGWTEGAGDDWTRVPDIAVAAELVRRLGDGTVLLTTGRRDLAVFVPDDRHEFVVRSVDPPSGPVPRSMTLLLDRGPYTVAGERSLIQRYDVRTLVTKDSGGDLTVAKLVAARELKVPVIMVDRPAAPQGVPAVGTVPEATAWVRGVQSAAG